MINKQFEIVAENIDQYSKSNLHAFLFLGLNHIGIILKDTEHKKVLGLEVFTFNIQHIDWFDIFYYTKRDAKLLDVVYNKYSVFINFPEAVLVPDKLFKYQEATTLLTTSFGINEEQIVNVEKVTIKESIFNVFALQRSIDNNLNSSFYNCAKFHNYNSFLTYTEKYLFKSIEKSTFFSVQIFEQEAIIALFINERLQIIKSYNIKTADDIVFHLVNICNNFKLETEDVVIIVSGLLTNESLVITYMQKYFSEIKFDENKFDQIQWLQEGKYPSHYFLPYLQIAL
jgi:hypothetical protein